ncbi:hypothetical protein GCM10011380_18760 [Sphingomonas metalli]|uniref:Ferritin-like domain-containing protein n=1 Tax=Sphingomonas metalli TaxID=1779358 RepID=A0A916WTV5_9SPHN|nr:ferritin-like domain-containing protein [Sphingomonas metalli]GGB29493.1 hypothetical protein GCM10011380_18760 [Sphingomonas metalli]
MADSVQMMEALDNRVRRRDERREFFKAALGMGALAAGGAAALTFSTKASAQTQTITDVDILNFALNLEYLEAQFYAYAATGSGIAANLQTGTGRQGAVITGNSPHQARQVNFTDAAVRAYAQEIAADEVAHVAFLRTAIGTTSAVAQPAINISGDRDGPFTAAASAAGVPLSSDGVFDPYSSDEAFLLGAYIFEDVGVTAYKGASPLLTNKTFLQAAAGILATEAYHAAIVRATLYAKGIGTPAIGSAPAVTAQPGLITAAQRISDARDLLDGTGSAALGMLDRSSGRVSGGDLDQGLTTTTSGQTNANIVPADTNGLAYSRTAGQVLNIVYLNLTTAATTMGGFFPNGVNGNINASIGTA